jgi:hypothetical protein
MAINLTTLPSNIGGISVSNATKGPLAALYGSKYDKAQYRYPRDLGSNPARKHSIVFTALKHSPQQLSQVGSDANALVAELGSLGGVYADVASKASDILKNGNLSMQQKIEQIKGTVSNAPTEALEIGSKAKTLFDSVSQFTIKGNRIPDTTIGLYIPDTVNVTYASSYDSDVSLSKSLGRLYFLAQGATSLAETFKNQKDVSMTNMINAAGNDPFVRDLVFGAAGKALGMDQLNRLAVNAAGYALNPQIQVLFRGIGFRSFQFNFVFTPYNKEESQLVKEIITKFKYHAAPQIDSNGLFGQGMYMKIPDSFDIKFYYGNEENRNVHRIGECVLENVDVNYAGSGQWSTFNDGAPNQITLTLQFKETIIIDKNRIDEGY